MRNEEFLMPGFLSTLHIRHSSLKTHNFLITGFLTLAALFFFLSCSSQKLQTQDIVIERDGRQIAIVKAEIARTQEERSTGLMYREELNDGEGMLFVFEFDQVLSFWMRNTYIPLSIAYIASDGTIIDILNMYPLDETSVRSSRSVRYALETPMGWFSRAGVREGDRVRVEDVN